MVRLQDPSNPSATERLKRNKGALMEIPYSQLVQYAYEENVRLGLNNRPDLYSPVTKVLSMRIITKLLNEQ